MGQIEDSADGIQLAKDVAVTAAEGDEQGILRLINAATPNQLGYATAYLAQMVAAAFKTIADGDADQGLAMLVIACSEDTDTFDTQTKILLSEDPDGPLS